MKIYTSNYRSHWLSPYTILEKFFFWRKGYDAYEQEPPKWLNNFSEGLYKFLNTVHPRINFIKIDQYDAWNADQTIASIVLPILREVKKDKHGASAVDNEDCPEHLMSCYSPRVESEWDIDDFFFLRYEWMLGEIIWSFEQIINKDHWEEQYYSGNADYMTIESDEEDDGIKLLEIVKSPNHTQETDWEGMKLHQKRINNGLRLFGKYFQSFWT